MGQQNPVAGEHVERVDASLAGKFAALFEHMQEGVALHELVMDDNGQPADYRILDVNPQFEQHTGLRRAEVVGRLASSAYGTAVAPYLADFATVAMGGPPLHLEVFFEPLKRHFSILVAPLGPRSFATIFSDVTFAKSQAEAIDKNRLAQRALLDNQPHLAWLKDRDSRFLAVNKAFAEACGQPSPEAVVGKTDFDVWPQQLAEAYRADDRAVMAAGKQKMVEEPIAEVDGTRWFETYKSPVFEPDGSIVGTTGIARDVTERKRAELARLQAERAVAQTRERLLSVSELAHIGHFSLDFSSQAVTMTPEIYRIVALDPMRFPSTFADMRALIHEEDRAAALQAVELARRSSQAQRFHLRLLRPSGEVRYCLAIVEVESEIAENAAPQAGQPANGIYGLIQDLTEVRRAEDERRKLEQQVMHSQKLESLGVLAGGIAHDFNNLLTSILGNADLAQNELSPANPARPYLEDIERVSRRAADLCRQMLAYSGKGRFVVQPISLNEVVREMGHLLKVSISKKVVIKYNFFAELPSAMADATQMRQVVMNLITNASEAIGESSGVVTLSTGVMDCDHDYLKGVVDDNDEHLAGQYVYIEVSDTGCGMDQDTLGRIFDPFFSTKFTGRGLGLAAVLGIVRGHRGALRVYSEKGRGTTFKVLLPAHHQPAPATEAGRPASDVWRGSGLVLLADDEESIRSMGRHLLERFGFAVVVAADGRQAVDLFQQHRADIRLVILDMTMPHLDGEACYRELRRIEPEVKVIMTSGYNEQDVINRFVGKGLAGFVQKPYKASDLLPVVRRVLDEE